jgi:hypothetical protein
VRSAAASPRPHPFGEILDRIVLLAPPLTAVDEPAFSGRSRPSSLAPVTLATLHRTARRRAGQPLARAAAAGLAERLRPGDRVLIATGLVTPRIPRGETDGPPGAAVLARALVRRFGARVLLITEAAVCDPVAAALEALSAEGDGDGWPRRVAVRAFPCDVAAAKAEADRILRREAPRALISIEKLGPNSRGVIHNLRGQDVTATQARVDLLFAAAPRAQLFTVGVGDRGNELGLGGLAPRPRRCVCPCGGCLECAVPADAPVVAFSSNWGAYALCAALGRAVDPPLVHRPATETRMLRCLAKAGAVDGVTGRREPTVDGVSAPVQAAVVGLLYALTRAGRRA